MSSEMRECPFCGNQPRSGWCGTGVPGMDDCGYWGIDCCNAFAHADTEAEALAQWNRRPLLARTEAGAVDARLSNQDDFTVLDCPRCGSCVQFVRKDAETLRPNGAAPVADGAVAQVLQVYKAEDEEEEAWFGHVEFTEPLKIGDLLYTHPPDASAGDACFVALQEIISAHANDNVRPRAFYIAADALAALQQKGSGNG